MADKAKIHLANYGLYGGLAVYCGERIERNKNGDWVESCNDTLLVELVAFDKKYATCEECLKKASYPRDDKKYEYIEQSHMMTFPSSKHGWEQILRKDGIDGQTSFYVWRRIRK